MMTQPQQGHGPYAQAAGVYWDAGWRGVLPLPARAKKSPPAGWTGRQGAWPSRADVAAWAETDGAGNIALRLPRTVIGLDVDNYGTKLGAATVAEAEAKYGPLPATWRSTSRDDGASGIRLYQVPEGLAWPGELGPGTEIIQHNHRYTVAWPSVHPEGRVYRWITPDGAISVHAVPAPDQLPELPESWITGLTGGQIDGDLPKADLDDIEAVAWLVKYGEGEPCGYTIGEINRYAARFTGTASRHDAAMNATRRLCEVAAEGHRGAFHAIDQIRHLFVNATEKDTSRPSDSGEWKRLLTGAVRLAAVDATDEGRRDDPCAAVTVLDLSILNDAAVPPVQAAEVARNLTLDAEIERERVRREVRRRVDSEEAARDFREPPSRPTLVEELTIPDEPVTYMVDQIMPTGANVLLTAQFKAGKTTLINHLTRCLADSEPFLGKFRVGQPNGRIGLFNYEVDDKQYRRWLREVGIAAEPLVSVLNLRGYRLPLINNHVEDWVVRWLVEHEIAVWIVDPFARAYVGSGVSENDNTEVGRFLDTLDVIKERAGVGELVLPTHTGREVFEAGQERARGATRLDDWADVRWMLTKDDTDTRFFSATGRDVEFAESALRFDERTRSPRITGASRAKESNRRLQDAIVSVVTATPGISLRQMRVAVRQIVGKVTNTAVDDAVLMAELACAIRVVEGPNRSRQHFPMTVTRLDDDGGRD